MWNGKKRVAIGLWEGFFCLILFIGVAFLLSGCSQPLRKEKQKKPETKEEFVAEKKKILADMEEEGKIIMHAERLSDSQVKLTWDKADDDFIYYVYQKDTEEEKELLEKVTDDSYTVEGLDKKKQYEFLVEAYYAWQGEENGQSVAEDIYMGESLPLTVITGGAHFMNVEKLQAKRESVTLQEEQMHSIRCQIWLKDGEMVYDKPKLYYHSTDPSIADVDESGCITAKGKGTAVVFVMAPNGVYDKVSVEVE